MAGSVASQAFGVAAGIQGKFSWKGVALAGISAGVAAGLAGSFGEIAGSPFLGDAVRGALGSAIGQGIGVATGLQSKFDFAGVAAAGLGMAVSGAIGLDGFGGRLARNTAGGLANAAARSLLDGTSFGDNILAALPDIIGQTVGDAVAGKVAARNTERRESLSGIRASTATEGASDLGGGDLFRLIVEAARQMLGLSDEASIVVTGQRESWRDIAYGPVENRFADLLQQQRITSTLSLRDQVRRFDGYQSPPARPPGTSISSAPRGALGYGSNVVGSVGHYVQGLTASTLKSIVSSGGNTGQMFRDAIGNGSHAATAIVSETLGSLYPDNDDMFSAQARAANNARHPFLLDPNHVSSNAEKREIIAATVVSLVGARGMGVRGGAGVAEGASARHVAWSSDLGAINDTAAALGQRALRNSGGDWAQSEALFNRYLSLADARLARTGSGYAVELQPAAIGGGERVPSFIWMHRGDATSPLIMGSDGAPRLFAYPGSRRLDAGIVDMTALANQHGLRQVVSGYDITLNATKPPVGGYYREYFGNIPITDIRPRVRN